MLHSENTKNTLYPQLTSAVQTFVLNMFGPAFLLVDRQKTILETGGNSGEFLRKKATVQQPISNVLLPELALEAVTTLDNAFAENNRSVSEHIIIDENDERKYVQLEAFPYINNNADTGLFLLLIKPIEVIDQATEKSFLAKKTADGNSTPKQEKLPAITTEIGSNEQVLLNHTPYAFFLIDEAFNIIALNEKAKKSVRSSLTNLQPGESVFKLIHPHNWVFCEKEITQAFKGNSFSEERQVINENGISNWYRYVYQPVFNAENAVTAVSLGIIDTTESNLYKVLLHDAERTANIGAWSYNTLSSIFACTAEFYNLFELKNTGPLTLEQVFGFFRTESDFTFENAFENTLETGEHFKVEAKLRTAKNAKKWFKIIGKANQSGVKPELVTGTIQDITAVKVSESLLAGYQQELFRLQTETEKVHDFSLDIITTIDKNGRFMNVNNAARQIWGYSPAELQGKNFRDLLAPDDQEFTEEATAAVLNGTVVKDLENNFIRKDGAIVQMLWSASADPEEGIIYAIGRDVTQKKAAELALKHSERKYRLLFMNSPMPMWIFDVDTLQFLEVNQAAITKYGYTREEFLQKTILDIRPSEDSARVRERNLYSEINLNEHAKWRHSEETIWRHIKKNGETIFLTVSSFFLEYNNRNARLVLSNDVSKIIESELELKQNNEEIRTILESIPDCFFVLNRNWEVTYWNKGAENFIGISQNQIIGRNFKDVFPSPHTAYFIDQYEKAMAENISIHFEQYYAPVKGWIEVMVYPSEKGLSIYFKDITESKRITSLDKLREEVLAFNARPENTLTQTINCFLTGLEKIHPGMICSFMRVSHDKLYPMGAPSLPEAYLNLIQGIPVAKGAGSCGNAAFFKEKVIVADIENDALWADYKELALAFNLKSCWSYPILDSKMHVMGLLGIYSQEVKTPNPEEEKSLETAADLLELIMENRLAEEALKLSNERYNLATAATNDAIYDWNILTDRIYWGAGFNKLFGHQASDRSYSLNNWFINLVPEDKDRVINSLNAALADESVNLWHEEYRYLKADNEVAYVVEKSTILRDQDKKAIRMVGAMRDITERKLANEELRKLALVARETINGIVIMDIENRIIWANDAFTRITGFTLEEAFGQQAQNLIQGPETSQQTLEFLLKKCMLLEPVQCEIAQYNKNGALIWIRLQIQPIFDEKNMHTGFFGMQTDITKRKKEEEQLKLFESVITNTTDAVTISKIKSAHPLDLEVIFLNQAYTEITGYSLAEIRGLSPGILNGPETDAAELQKLEQAIINQTTTEVQFINYRKDGSKFWVNLSVIPITNEKGIITHWISMQRDITLRKNQEKEREALIGDLTQNNYDLKQFSFITSHNLRAPLSNLIGALDLLDMNAITTPRNKLLITKFRESTQQLNQTLNDLLEILVIKNSFGSRPEKVSLGQSFNSVVNSLEKVLADTGCQISTDFSEGDEIYANPGYVHSILQNLLTNSIKYCAPDKNPVIILKTRLINAILELDFTDNGLGIDLNRYGDRIFGLYQRFHNHPDSKGLGLYITHSQIKAMGGNIRVESEVNKGTTFIIQFKAS